MACSKPDATHEFLAFDFRKQRGIDAKCHVLDDVFGMAQGKMAVASTALCRFSGT